MATDTISIVAFSDCRTQSIPVLLGWIRSLPHIPDLIVYAGDDCKRFRPNEQINYFELLAELAHYGLVAVAGNDDVPGHRSLIQGANVYEVHSNPTKIGPIFVVGIEGAPYPSTARQGLGIGPNLHQESEIARHIHSGLRNASENHILIVSHAPPNGILDLAMRHGRYHIGWTELRRAVERSKDIQLVICGHVHRQGGKVERLKNTLVVNAASHDGFADPLRIAEIRWPLSSQVPPPEFAIQWHLLYEQGELTSISGIGVYYATKLKRAGLVSVRDLAEADPAIVAHALGRREIGL